MDKKTIQTYDQIAEVYDTETIDFWARFPDALLDKFAELARGRILDVGSGPGRDGLLLQQRGLDVTCLDASQAMIAISQKRGLRSIQGDFNSLPFEDNYFDGAWAYTSLLHVPKAEVTKGLDEIKRVLKRGGILGLGLIEGDSEGYRESAGEHMPRWFSFYTKKEVESLLERNNFKIVYFDQIQPRSKNYLHFIAQKQ